MSQNNSVEKFFVFNEKGDCGYLNKTNTRQLQKKLNKENIHFYKYTLEHLANKYNLSKLHNLINLLSKTEGKVPPFSCGICNFGYENETNYPISFTCGHVFCINCIGCMEKSNIKKCPKCRIQITRRIRLYF
jgi:hypothetical protein